MKATIKPLLLALSFLPALLWAEDTATNSVDQANSADQSNLVEQTIQAQQQSAEHNALREQQFALTAAEVEAKRQQLEAIKQQLEQQTEALNQQFNANEDELARLEEKLRLETGSLGELFGVVRQVAKELQLEGEQSLVSISNPTFSELLDDIVAATVLPSIEQLNALWLGMQTDISAGAELQQLTLRVLTSKGDVAEQSVYRLGNVALIGEQGFLKWDAKQQLASAYLKQPDNAPTLNGISELIETGLQSLAIDPTLGVMLEQLGNTPSLSDRLAQGGVVGKVILALLLLGLAIGGFHGWRLFTIGQKITQQLKSTDQPGDNPLGRILSVYNEEQSQTLEALELRLLEAIVDEQQGLEKGLSMIKLLAALAPMLGLLGTVTGMIETFQMITQFGNGDPAIMANGISMALITTVLGLVAAMPLLLLHNLLSSQADHIRVVLEKQGIGLVANKAESAQEAAYVA
ncbi:MotA/TolQ/ExbB proton channel family protein [Reinekea thalattae]|uniref:Flagellar motor protein MotA n=1 Tax=Reinekea thalattae TaxID=2593301 RepID=A0A5C8Z232_9GAMM|nr:MotA/TolQ/ExbB proton channel family protein [Reinekea thalattae]TXR52135.1 flagellar motor protein MotA [Reinekea thalattae]